MGLPHILVRFYTNPDGSAARRTTVRVLGLLGAFYLFPAVYGLLGRAFTPELYTTGDTDSVVLRVPAAAWPGLPGDILAAIVAAGAFAAFMSTASGLLVSIAGTVSHDVIPGKRRRRRARFRVAAVAGMIPPALLALATREVDISVLVGWAFALAASTFCPLLLLGIWWPRLTARGAAAGMIAGAIGRDRDDRRGPDRRRVRGDRDRRDPAATGRRVGADRVRDDDPAVAAKRPPGRGRGHGRAPRPGGGVPLTYAPTFSSVRRSTSTFFSPRSEPRPVSDRTNSSSNVRSALCSRLSIVPT